MVATAGRVPDGRMWRLAPSLVALIDESDRKWPHRSRISDGSIGDAAHSARTSDHNPDASLDVNAVDITEDHANGPDLEAFWRAVIARRDPRVKYVIYERRIVASYPTTVAAWTPRPYSGINAHRHHLHVSVLDTPAARRDTRPWFTASKPPPEENDMTKDECKQAIREVLDEHARRLPGIPQDANAFERFMEGLWAGSRQPELTVTDVQTAVDRVLALHSATNDSGLRNAVQAELAEALSPPELA